MEKKVCSKRNIEEQASSIAGKGENSGSLEKPGVLDDAFEKELTGLTGGFPGGEKGLKKIFEENLNNYFVLLSL
ncbi:hypothetical protein SADUNF_Sadunf03G0105000 [Salix dunnii]|uniref:Uncharacterized protein n=1 Tax=Salix dunnii TaxID=1413687 RepID=A0A835N218_9ROSI|nr:hypothetical protein SADUNF_Sadunf03G0105000 [Salix dunnii]